MDDDDDDDKSDDPTSRLFVAEFGGKSSTKPFSCKERMRRLMADDLLNCGLDGEAQAQRCCDRYISPTRRVRWMHCLTTTRMLIQ